jgi:hypothetical protein
MRQKRLTRARTQEVITFLEANRNMTYKEASYITGCTRTCLISLCTRRGFSLKRTPVDQRGSLNVNYFGGLSRATVGRMTKKVLLEEGRDLFKCERCGKINSVELPRHHKNRDRADNEASNLEVLCVSCHNKEHRPEKIISLRGRFIK